MPRWGYALTAVLALALAAYVLWPEPGGGPVAPFPDALAEPFTVSGALGEQRVSLAGVRVAGLDRAPERKRIAAFIARARALRVPAASVVEDIDAAAARAYGIDGTRRLVADGEERQWGTTADSGAVWDPARRRLWLVGKAELQYAVALAERLDDAALLELPDDPAWLELDGVRLTRRDGAWRFPTARPPADGRVATLLLALRGARLETVAAAEAVGETAHVLRLPGAAGGETGLSLRRADGRTWLVAEGLPPQPLSAAVQARWLEVCAALREDRLCDPAFVAPPRAVRAWRDGRPLLALVRRLAADADGAPAWDVRWDGGSEPADATLPVRLRDALLGLAVAGVQPATEPAGGLRLEVELEDGPPLRAVFTGDRAVGGGWSGTIGALPPLLAGLSPEACFDPRPCAVDPLRLAKLQRRWPGAPARDETYARAGGGWVRSHPAGGSPADAAAVARLARSLARLRAAAVRRATAAERAATPEAELAVRIAPLAVARTGAGADDDIALEDTLPQDRAFALLPAPAGGERLLLDRGGGLAFVLDAADAEELLAEVVSARLFPLAPALVAAVEVAGATRFRLERQGADWRLRDAAGTQGADALAVRRLLRALAGLVATAPVPPPPGPPAIVLVVETVDGERIAAEVRLAPDGPLARTARGTTRLDPAAWAQVVLDPAAYRQAP